MHLRSLTTSRRTALRAGATGAALVGASALSPLTASAEQAPTADTGDSNAAATEHSVFQHGVASGDPLPNSVLLWTRATSHAGDIPGSGAGHPVNLRWEVATDEAFSSIVASGTTVANPAADQTVKVEPTGLAADTWFYFRFIVADGEYSGQISPIGRTRTTPPVNSSPEHLGIALTSCANFETGYFSAYGDMARNDGIDIVMCVGDYIYEYGTGEYAGKTGPIRTHQPEHEIVTLQDYRRRYGEYRTDSDLQEAHRVKPWVVTWDDHEVANDSYHNGAENHTEGEEGSYAARRDAAIQAYLEWLPVRATTFSEQGHLYRSFNYGDLAEIVMLDLRTYRDQPVEFKAMAGIDDESRSMLGSEQFEFLRGQWTTSSATWNIVGNSVMFTPVLIPPMDPEATRAVTELLGMPEEGIPYNFDQWDGFAAERRKLIDLMGEHQLDNVVFLTGDIHSSWACNVPRSPGRYPVDGVAAMEFVCTSVSAPNIDDIVKLPQRNGISLTAETALTGVNRHVKYLEFDHHGYAAIHFTSDEVRAEYRFVQDKTQKDQELFVAAQYVGRRGSGVTLA
ncbi:alkaline phosphatase D family protein [Corynebacterium sp. H78]|uniref:alkaline phosphatase D family protein n=1 Tax=Corynebacterium sp. H78 TaxID=3133417 RepID=UPI0030A467C2